MAIRELPGLGSVPAGLLDPNMPGPGCDIGFGSFRTGNLIDNGSFEDGLWNSTTEDWELYGWESVVSNQNSRWRRSTQHVEDGQYSAKLYTPGQAIQKDDYAILRQTIELHQGAQADQLGLSHTMGITCQGMNAVPGVTGKLRVAGIQLKEDGTEEIIAGRLDFSVVDGDNRWQFEPASYFTETELAQLIGLRIDIQILFEKTIGDQVELWFDACYFYAEGGLSRQIGFGDSIQRASIGTKYVRAGDPLGTLRWRNEQGGRSKRKGTIPIRMSKDYSALHGLWAYGRRTYLLWWPRLVHYPPVLAIAWQNDFDFTPENPNLNAGYRGAIQWAEI